MGGRSGEEGADAASKNLGLTEMASLLRALCWPYVYPWRSVRRASQRLAFDELARRWLPIL